MVKQRPEQVAKLLKYMNIHIRNIQTNIIEAIDAEAERKKTSRQELIVEALNHRFGESPQVVMWIQGKMGEQDDTDCPECGQEIRNPWVGLLNTGEFTQVVCEFCATSA